MPYRDPEKKLEWQKKNREKKRLQKPVLASQYSDNLPSESTVKSNMPSTANSKPTETDCAKFRRIMTSPKRNPDDRFWANAHACHCDDCARWNVHEKKDSEWDFKGVNLWGEPETNIELDEQKQLVETLKKEGFDYKRSSNPSEKILGIEGSRELERNFFDDKKQERDPRLDEWKAEDEAIRQKMREDYQKRECKKYRTEEKPELEQKSTEQPDNSQNQTSEGSNNA